MQVSDQPLMTRPMQADDAAAVVGLIHGLAATQSDNKPTISAAALLNNYQRPGFEIIVATIGNEIIGYLGSSTRFNLEYAADEWTMDYLFVAEGCRGQGIAQRLIGTWADMAMKAGVGCLRTSASKTNFAANRLYKAAGFQNNEVSQQRYVAYSQHISKLAENSKP